MPTEFQIETPRLLLRAWRDEDRAPFAAINADPEVMRYFAGPLTAAETDETIDRYNTQLVRDGFTMFAVEERETHTLAGVLGMQTMRIAVPNLPQPSVEIGWRLALAAQGRGLATEGARAIIDHAFNTLGLPQVVAITTPSNQPSRNVMEKLSMTHRPELTFIHPNVPADHRLQPHVLYSLTNPVRPEALCSTHL